MATVGSSADKPQATTVSAIADSIAGPGSIELPLLLASILIPRAEKDKGPVGLTCRKHQEEGVLFLAYARVSPLLACFIKCKRTKTAADTEGPPAKRTIKASVIELPSVNVPLVGELTQPFDEMFVSWVQEVPSKKDSSSASSNSDKQDSPSKGVTRAELDAINAQVKQANTETSSTFAEDIL